MKLTRLNTMQIHTARLARAALALVCSVVLLACGGGGSVPASRDEMRPLPAEFSTRKAVDYSPYRTDEGTSQPPLAEPNGPNWEANIKQDMDLLVAGGFGLIRLFDSGVVAETTLRVIRNYNMNIKVQLGVYIQGAVYAGEADRPRIDTYNKAQIVKLVKLANQYRDIVIAVSVGNENMVYWSGNLTDPALMAGYIVSARSQITQPVTSDDNWAFYADPPRVLIDSIDYVSMHTYAELDTVFNPTWWDWKQEAVPEANRAVAMMNASIASAKREFNYVRALLDSKNLPSMPIVIGETGWNAVDVGTLKFRASPINQKMYYDLLTAWVAEGRAGRGPKAIFYFEAFDEPWKKGDDKWGLFNVNRQARCVIQALSATYVKEAGSCADAALYYKPPKANDPVTQNRYVIFADSIGASDLREAGLQFDPFVNTFWAPVADFPVGDGPTAYEIEPRPEVWGWGMLYQSRAGTTTNLSNFANGALHLSLKTTYVGKLEVALLGLTRDGDPIEAYLSFSSGQYGYANDGAWHEVTIPIKDITSKYPKFELSLVTGRFVIADRYAATGNPAGNNTKIKIDAIYISK